ncbi:FG-GAP repeat domain-containing protein [Zobellia nedashkovskayae]
MRYYLTVFALSFLFVLSSCNQSKKENKVDESSKEKTPKLFREVSSDFSGIDFVNTLEESLESNYYQYMYTYIGGGVAVGDLNDDGFDDIYFTSNSSEDKLYLNTGNLHFKDITKAAGIEQQPGFNTGVTMVDVNGDGFLDIYVSRGGWQDEDGKFKNLLYINNGPVGEAGVSFTERAEEMGLADSNRTIQATFFDYDKDNDLDVYVSNTPDITSKIENNRFK